MAALNSLAFLLLGLLMGYCPALLPHLFPPLGNNDTNTSALWLELMGSIQGSVGAFYLLRDQFLPSFRHLRSLRMPRQPGLARTERLQPGIIIRPLAHYPTEQRHAKQRMAA